MITPEQMIARREVIGDNGRKILKDNPGLLHDPTITIEEIELKRAEYKKNIPPFPKLPDGFFKDYMDFGIRMNYAVPDFHFGAILPVLSTAIGRKVVMRSTSQKVYCNVYVMIVGQTTISGKTTACNLGVDHFYSIIEQEGVAERLTKKNSPQSVIQRMTTVPNRLWHYDECAEFFEDIGNRWAAALESILCSLYDGSQVSYGLAEGKGKVNEWKVIDPFLSCLWNTTDGEIDRHATWTSFSNGFFPRFQWYWNFSECIPRRNRALSDEDAEIRSGLEHQIQDIRGILAKIPGNDMIVFNPSDIIEEWKIKNDLTHLTTEDELYRIATGRLYNHAYKIAMMMALMDKEVQNEITSSLLYPRTLEIPDRHAQTALKIVDEYLRPRILYLADLCQSNQHKSGQSMIIKILKKYGGVASKSLILRYTHIRSKVMDELLTTMEESGVVTLKTQTTATKDSLVVILNV